MKTSKMKKKNSWNIELSNNITGVQYQPQGNNAVRSCHPIP